MAKLISRLKKLFFRRDIVILIGDSGTFFFSVFNGDIVDNLYMPIEQKIENSEEYRDFLSKFKKSRLFFLIHHSACVLNHESVPVLQSFAKKDPIRQFVAEHFVDDIVAYSIYDSIVEEGEVLQTIIASTSYDNPLKEIVEYSLDENRLKFGGIYFFALEVQVIIDDLLRNSKYDEYKEYYQIFVTILENGKIKIVRKHHRNIISIKNVEYPCNISLEYLQGVIEQAISDDIIASKTYVEERGLKICVISLLSRKLNSLLGQSSSKQLNNPCLFDSQFEDNPNLDIVRLFFKTKTYKASSQWIRTFLKYDLINNWIFKPIIFIIILAIGNVALTQFYVLMNRHKTLELNKSYYQMSLDYRNFKKSHPEIENISQLIDFNSLLPMLKSSNSSQFELVDDFFALLPKNMKVRELSCSLLGDSELYTDHVDHNIQVEVNLEMVVDSKLLPEDSIKDFISLISAKPNYSIVEYKVDYDNLIILGGQKKIPIIMTLVVGRL